ncbi:lantibiotic immunity ABC transporter MutE/EpiE family permease subunit [Aedoeadaptatus coli]|uniref:lantibiotic immunity ABC transporter MutE/EpiE family permease subunit n=1 Tax=Aedoeadaptatus coli TaxID=2058292 RepID=UPI000D562E22|nr:lantibiotic immunity ABC transporter MutE/EpiE family permease subunit [Peptoniphilus coli]
MKKYILAEHLKQKHTFLKAFVVIMSLMPIVMAFVLMPSYFSVNAYNWWYVILLPATFALVPAMVHRRDERKLDYRAVFPLHVDLKKVWVSKVVVASVYVLFAAVIHVAGVGILQPFLSSQLTPNVGWDTLIFASGVLFFVNLWQVPLCLFLAKKFGLSAAVSINILLGAALGAMFADTSMWLLCPYAWGARLMVPILHLLPNGLVAKAVEPMIENTSILIPCVLSLGIFILLSGITARWFAAREVK